MYAKHYHPYTPSLGTNILETYRKHGWTPPSEDPTIRAKWEYYQECAWRKETENVH